MPLISVITATYNRSNVLRHAVASVRRQTLTDWELIVVGDACTDDTASVVTSVDDARIRFVNLDRNHGEQSVPNNHGVGLATGAYLAFLNHDDLWFSDHLMTVSTALERSRADLAYSLSARVDAEGRVHLWGDSPEGVYRFWHPVPASVWLMRRELAEQVGPWAPAWRLWDSPSQHWLRRAHASGAALTPVPRLTAVQITSGGRTGSYRNRDQDEHDAAALAMHDEAAYREQLLTDIAIGSSSMSAYSRPLAPATLALKATLARLSASAGIPPAGLFNAIRYRRRGGFIRHLRKVRGLTPATEDRK
ncbi:MAG TPA: glycosyltransferase [Vicinamibacterales bacterium]|nr:glycosyltransferase [Vicinamibacterales bacterium]